MFKTVKKEEEEEGAESLHINTVPSSSSVDVQLISVLLLFMACQVLDAHH